MFNFHFLRFSFYIYTKIWLIVVNAHNLYLYINLYLFLYYNFCNGVNNLLMLDILQKYKNIQILLLVIVC